jgi:predicted permease
VNWLNRIFSRRRIYGDLSEEMRSHLEEKIEELMAKGMSSPEAAYAARREFGNLTRLEEDARTVWQWPSLENFLMDVRYGLRILRQSPGFSAIAILMLAFGIGANAAIFSLVNSVLLRPLPYRDAARLVWVSNEMPVQHTSVVLESDYFAWRKSNHVFEDVAAYDPGAVFTLTGAREPEHIQAGNATYNFLDVLGVAPRLGRGFRSEEDRAGAAHVVLLTDSLWRRSFSGDAGILGGPISLDGEPYTVIGVLPPGFEFLDNDKIDAVVPLALEHYEVAVDKPMRIVSVVGRLRPGITPATAAADIDATNQRVWATYPPDFAQMLKGVRARVVPVQERLVGNVRPALLVLLGAVGFVLLITCANIANLQLARAVSREKDFAIRGALGAGRWRLVRQLLTENSLLALAGGAGGLAVAWWLLALIRLWGPKDIPHLALARLDYRVLLFAAALSLLTGILFGLSPALAAFRIPFIESLRASGSRDGAGSRVRRPHSILMVGELAVALVLFVGAGLLIRSFVQLISIPPGFDARGVLTARVSLPPALYRTSQQRMAFFHQLDEGLAAIPGVTSAGLASVLPLQGTNWGAEIQIEGRQRMTLASGPPTEVAEVTPGYFSALHIRLVEGRLLEAGDARDSANSLLVNEAFVRRYFPEEDAVGKRLRLADENKWWTIVGIIGDTKQHGLAAAVEPELFMTLGDSPQTKLVLRTSNDPVELVPAVRSIVAQLDRNLPLFEIATMDSLLSREVASQRFNAALLSGFAVFALLLASLGIYGVMAYAVGQRTHEIGVRMALGAAPKNVLRMVLSRGLLLALAGVVVGLTVSFPLTRFLRALLYGVEPTDPLTFLGVTLLLVAVCFVACWLPARRAMRVDPMVALRHE